MAGWNTSKRFWKSAGYAAHEDGFAIQLDGRSLKTPAKTPVVVPTEELAKSIAAEWQAQGDQVDPLSMPFTRTANSALDKVAIQKSEVADMLADYGGTDLLCYRADAPTELVARQAENWDPVLDWAADTLKARLHPVSGVMFQPQNQEALETLRAMVQRLTCFQLAAFHDLVCMSGSLVLGFAAVEGYCPAEACWTLSRLDELWQEEQWGRDEEAHALSETKRLAFLHAHRFFKIS